jgi:hypothetical protein
LNQILEDLEFSKSPNIAEIEALKVCQKHEDPKKSELEIVRVGNEEIKLHYLQKIISNPSMNLDDFSKYYLKYSTLFLSGRTRFEASGSKPRGNYKLPPENSLQRLLKEDSKREEVRRIVKAAFESFFVLDALSEHIEIRLSTVDVPNNTFENTTGEEQHKFFSAATPIDRASDGIRAFIGIIIEVIAGDPRVLLIDEPEAFLHPALATKLGYELANAAQRGQKVVFVSTHSSSFLMGCIQSGVPVTIIRLTHRAQVSTARVLPSNELVPMMRHPLLRSSNILSGLFYEFVVVTESDTDRAFYQEINERLLRFKPEWAIPNCLFINAQNKQTVPTLVTPLRKMGIPAAGIVDVDVLKEGGSVWTAQLEGAFIPDMSHQSLGGERTAIKSALDLTQKNMKRDGGILLLSGGNLEAAEDLFLRLSTYGLFVVTGGELESWLKPLKIPGHGPDWLIKMFERMGEDPGKLDYVKPCENDVWKFMANVSNWLRNPNRKGIPD